MARKHYIIAVQFTNKTIGGMAQRFIRCADFLITRGEDFACVSTTSLASHMGVAARPGIVLIDDSSRWRVARELFVCFRLVVLAAMGRVQSVHFAGGGRIEKALMTLLPRLSVKTSVTFASRTLRMASYNNPGPERAWRKLLDTADRIDVLNPGHDLVRWADKISVSPCSFPARLTRAADGTLELPDLQRKERLVLFAGAFVSTKNPLLAIAGFHQFVAASPARRGWMLRLVGKGPLGPACQERASQVNHLLGYEAVKLAEGEDLFRLMQRAAIFLSLQDYDNYPSQVLMEAMLFGCSVVATSDGDTEVMFRGCEGNELIASKDAAALAAGLEALARHSGPNESNVRSIASRHTLPRFADYFRAFTAANSDSSGKSAHRLILRATRLPSLKKRHKVH